MISDPVGRQQLGIIKQAKLGDRSLDRLGVCARRPDSDSGSPPHALQRQAHHKNARQRPPARLLAPARTGEVDPTPIPAEWQNTETRRHKAGVLTACALTCNAQTRTQHMRGLRPQPHPEHRWYRFQSVLRVEKEVFVGG